METETTNVESNSEVLAEPHFDDEATVLSARRVVPLDEVSSYGSQATSHFARGWMFAATVVGALLFGVVASAAYYSYLNREAAHPVVNMENIASGADGMSTLSAANDASPSVNAPKVNNTPPADANAEVTLDEEQSSASQPAVSSKRPVARRVDVLTFPSTREERKAARRQAKAQKKELERESRDRNLMRIREIFEGPQKP
ncbi:MAG TPA: hypothetical protein VN951_04955 [Pyrinomonadaceae bacterium]|nr:hypothetical protein [Pyrinomonadaceae bacterium]